MRVGFDGCGCFNWEGPPGWEEHPLKNAAEQALRFSFDAGTMPPHIFALSDYALRSLRSEGKSQSILIRYGHPSQ